MVATEPMNITASPVDINVDPHRAYVTNRLEETFARHIGHTQPSTLTDAEWHEVVDACKTAAALLHMPASDRLWTPLITAATMTTCSLHVIDREAFKGACILVALATMWEDMDTASHDFDGVLAELRKICDRYYRGEDVQHAFEGMRTFLTYDHMFRNSSVARALCSTSLEQYFRFRVTDFFLDAWLRVSYPIYRNEMLAEHCRSGLTARMTVRATAVVNDAYTFAREKSRNDFINCFHLAPFDNDTNFRRFFDDIVHGIIEDITCIKEFDPVTRDVLLNVIYGNFIFCRDFYDNLEASRGF
jgi:hypothetical protein